MPAAACAAEGTALQRAALARIAFVPQVSCLVIFYSAEREEGGDKTVKN